MKNIIRLMAAVIIMAACQLNLSGCGDASQKHAADANQNFKEAGKDLKEAVKSADEEAKAKAAADWQQFKAGSDSSIAEMESEMRTLKQKINKSEKKRREKVTAELDIMESKLHAQKEKLKEKTSQFEAGLKKFDESANAQSESFKQEFRHDMKELGTAIQDLFRDNVKS